MRYVALIFVIFAVLIGIGWLWADLCQAKGGSLKMISSNAAICVSPDGRIL